MQVPKILLQSPSNRWLSVNFKVVARHQYQRFMAVAQLNLGLNPQEKGGKGNSIDASEGLDSRQLCVAGGDLSPANCCQGAVPQPFTRAAQNRALYHMWP